MSTEDTTPAAVPYDPREPLGRLVRETWVAWAKKQPDPKPSWLLAWEALDDCQREVDMLIGHAVANYALTENALTYNLACPRCAGFLDRANNERERAEAAEGKLAEQIQARLSRSVKLARIRAHCRQRLDAAIVQGPVSDLCRDILAIIGTDEEGGCRL